MSGDKKRILIVEDEKPLAHALELKLEHEGYTVELAQNGKQCLDLIDSKDFDIVLLDLMMPVLDGFKVLEQLQQKERKPAVFVLSNLSQQEDEARVYALGAQKYFVKADTQLSMIIDEVKKV
jgi:DNA-binding response OmpR family regulator